MYHPLNIKELVISIFLQLWERIERNLIAGYLKQIPVTIYNLTRRKTNDQSQMKYALLNQGYSFKIIHFQSLSFFSMFLDYHELVFQ